MSIHSTFGGGTGYWLLWIVDTYCLEYNAWSLVFISSPRMNFSFECEVNWVCVRIVCPSHKRRPQRPLSLVAIVEKEPRRNADPPIVKAKLCHRRATIFHDLVPSAIHSRFHIHRACNRRCVSGVHVWPFLLACSLCGGTLKLNLKHSAQTERNSNNETFEDGNNRVLD